mmetsp:Transcript_12921/g.11442  ORF Transcript_12921/g.11442 Transcript_12921/m.11442 type:complete len:92 (-) Transcript_12921:558-833(-)
MKKNRTKNSRHQAIINSYTAEVGYANPEFRIQSISTDGLSSNKRPITSYLNKQSNDFKSKDLPNMYVTSKETNKSYSTNSENFTIIHERKV